MRNSLRYFFDLAIKIADAKDDRRSFKVGACATRGDGVIVASANGPTPFQSPSAHAENRLRKKLDFGAIVYVCRILRKDGSLAIARPCPDCAAVLRSKRVKKVYYSISPIEYGLFNPCTNTDTYFRF
jgi:tRNA(Arg) A34 adenosine deaminase TadA